MDQAARFWDRVAERYSRQPVADEAAYQRKLQITREFFRSDMEVLEIGCGTGTTAISHAPYVKHIRAVDISAKMLEIARGRAAAAGVENVTFSQSPIDRLELPEQSADAVLALNILHLLDNFENVVARVYRALRPDGVFVTSTVCIGDMSLLFRMIVPVGKLLVPTLRIIGHDDVRDSLVKAGFSIEHDWLPGRNKALFIVAKKPA